ncbi:hypothetical protein RclHR1_00190029 [Rhizophagus clarus]|uniref:Uncharacterized protein n=1 Tax=Rhizophagus clarus TaxID=94130 RepID=A0A2Z6RGH6_9GLOM|nr:hypothetical protein RclHR1_00190029 [Rhizophagus clarus]GES90333.1 hypothetical protein RCL_e6432_RclHR1_00190029 [Rhizophagus clarus]
MNLGPCHPNVFLFRRLSKLNVTIRPVDNRTCSTLSLCDHMTNNRCLIIQIVSSSQLHNDCLFHFSR